MLGRNALWARGFGPRLDRWCRPHARRFERLDFSFAPVWLDLLLLAFRAYLFGRGWIRSGESGSPPLFVPFLNVEGNTGHLKLASSLAIRRVATARERRLASECRYFKFWHYVACSTQNVAPRLGRIATGLIRTAGQSTGSK